MSAQESPRPTSERIAYLVLGMHRSGTSAVTQLLALAGAKLPDNVMPGDEHNARGYFEPWKIAILNDERLRAAGTAWDDVFAYPHRPLPAREERRWLVRAEDLVEAEFGDVAFPLLKDPRVTVLLPFWRTVLADLGVTARCVIPVRHPLAVAGSLARRNGFTQQKSVLLWSAYMLAAEAYTRDLPRAFVGYDALLDDWRGQVKRIEAAHGAPLPALTTKAGAAIDQFLSRDLRHNEGGGDLAGLGWAGALAAKVLGWFEAAAAGDAPDTAPLQEAAAELERRREEVGVLVSPTTRDLDATRSELLETQRLLEAERAQARSQTDELAATLDRDRATLEAGWRADVARLEAEMAKERETMAAEREAFRRSLTETARALDAILVDD